MRKNSQATINASLLGVKPSQYIKFIEYMDSSKQEADVCSNLAQLCSPHSRISLSELDVPATKTLAKLYNKYTCRLISNNHSDKALNFIEMAQKLIGGKSLKHDQDAQLIRRAILNNAATYCYKIQNKELAVKLLEKFLRDKGDSKDYSFAIGFNNLAALHISNQSYDKAVKCAVRAIELVESDVKNAKSEFKKTSGQDEKLSSDFISKLKALLLAFLNLGISLEKGKLQARKSSEKWSFDSLDEKKFYEDGYKLSSKYLGKNSVLTIKFTQHLTRLNKGVAMREFKIRSKRTGSLQISDDQKDVPVARKKSVGEYREIYPRHRSSSSTSIDKVNPPSRNGRRHSKLSSVQSLEDSSIAKGLELIIKQQQALEEKVARKLEDTMQSTQSMQQQQLHLLKEKELNLQIEMLKRGKDVIMKRNLELELELAKLRSFQKVDSETAQSMTLISSKYFSSVDVNTTNQANMKYIAVPSPTLRESQRSQANVFTYNTLDICQAKKTSDCGSTNDFNSTQITQAGSDVKETPNPTNTSPERTSSGKKETIPSDFNELSMNVSEHDTSSQALSLGRISSLENQLRHEGRIMSLNTRLRLQNRGSDVQTLLELQDALTAKDFAEKHENLQSTEPNTQKLSFDLSKTETQQQEGTLEQPYSGVDGKIESPKVQIDTAAEKKRGLRHEVCTPINRTTIRRGSLKQPSKAVESQSQSELPLVRNKENEISYLPETPSLRPLGAVTQETGLLKENQSNFANSIDNWAKSSNEVARNPYQQQSSLGKVEEADEVHSFGRKQSRGSPSKMAPVKSETFGLIEPSSPYIYNQSEGNSQGSRFQLNRVETPQLEALKPNETKSGPGASIFKRENKERMEEQHHCDSSQRYPFGSPPKEGKDDSIFFELSGEPAISTISKRDSEHITSEIRADSTPSITNWKDLVEPISVVGLIESPDYLLYPSKSVITKQTFLLSPHKYLVECHFDSKESDRKLVLLLKESLAESNQFDVVAQEIIRFKDLQKILKHLDCRDSLPSTVPLKSIKTYGSFVRHIIMPFVGIGLDEDGGKRIEIWEKPCSMFRRFIELRIFGELCLVNFQHISGTDFRLVLTNVTTEKSIRLDVSLDQLSFTRYMTEIPLLSSSRSPNADLIELIDIFSDENATAEELQMTNVITCKYEGNEQENFEIPAVKFKDEEQEEAFYDQINSALTELEGFLKTKQINSFDQIASDLPLKYIKVNISGESQRKCAFYLQDNNEKHCVDVYMKNFFETHAPRGQKVQAEGHFEYKFDTFWKEYGVVYPAADLEDRKALLTLLSDCFNLEVQEKPLEPENYETNPIIKLTMDCGAFKRYYIGDGNKYPVTLSLIGVRGHPQGVKATIYNPEECAESGVLFLLQPADWIKLVDETEKKQQKRFTVPIPMKTDYNLCEVLSKSGFDLLNAALCFNKTRSKVELLGAKSLRQLLRLDLMENYINPVELIKLLRRNVLYQDLFSK